MRHPIKEKEGTHLESKFSGAGVQALIDAPCGHREPNQRQPMSGVRANFHRTCPQQNTLVRQFDMNGMVCFDLPIRVIGLADESAIHGPRDGRRKKGATVGDVPAHELQGFGD